MEPGSAGDLKGVTGRGHCRCKGSGTRAAWSTGGSSRRTVRLEQEERDATGSMSQSL